MTSPVPGQGDDAAPGQEGIWDEEGAPDPTAVEPAARSQRGGAGRDPRGLTASITSTRRTPGPAGLFYADVPNRIIAMIIDIIVLAIIGSLLVLLLGGLTTDPGALDAAGGDLELVPFVVVLVLQLALSLAYFGGTWTSIAGTPGMRVLGLRIGDETDGGALRWRGALIRWLFLGIPSMLASLAAYVPGLLGVLLAVVGIVWLAALLTSIANSPTRQGLHDRAAHTIVVRAGRRTD